MSNFLGAMRVCNINPCYFHWMNTTRIIRQRRGGVADGDNKVPPLASVERVAMSVNPVGLTNVEYGHLWTKCHSSLLWRPMPWLTMSTSRMFRGRTHMFTVRLIGRESLRALILLFSQVLWRRRILRSLWMRCIRFWFMGPTNTKKTELASYQLNGGYGGHIYWESTVGFLATQGFCTDLVQDVAILPSFGWCSGHLGVV